MKMRHLLQQLKLGDHFSSANGTVVPFRLIGATHHIALAIEGQELRAFGYSQLVFDLDRVPAAILKAMHRRNQRVIRFHWTVWNACGRSTLSVCASLNVVELTPRTFGKVLTAMVQELEQVRLVLNYLNQVHRR